MGKTVKMSFEGKSQQEPRNWQMDRILIILKKENDPRASSAHALGLNIIIFKHVYWYMQQTQVSGYRTIGPLVSVMSVLGNQYCGEFMCLAQGQHGALVGIGPRTSQFDVRCSTTRPPLSEKSVA